LPWPCCCCSPPVLEAAISGKLNSFTFYLCLHLLRDCLLLTGFALLAGRLVPLASFVVAWLILNIAAPLLAYGMGGHTGAMFVQPVVAMWMSSPDGLEQVGAWLSYVPWASLSLADTGHAGLGHPCLQGPRAGLYAITRRPASGSHSCFARTAMPTVGRQCSETVNQGFH
jgi:hypothetical protein